MRGELYFIPRQIAARVRARLPVKQNANVHSAEIGRGIPALNSCFDNLSVRLQALAGFALVGLAPTPGTGTKAASNNAFTVDVRDNVAVACQQSLG